MTRTGARDLDEEIRGMSLGMNARVACGRGVAYIIIILIGYVRG